MNSRPSFDYIKSNLESIKEPVSDKKMDELVKETSGVLTVLDAMFAIIVMTRVLLRAFIIVPSKTKETLNKVLLFTLKSLTEFAGDLPEETKDELEEAINKVKSLNL